MFSVSYSVTKKKIKNTKTTDGDRSQAKGEASTLKTGKLRYQTANMHVLVFMYISIAGELNLSSVIVLRRGDFSLLILLKLRSAVHVGTGYVNNVTRAFSFFCTLLICLVNYVEVIVYRFSSHVCVLFAIDGKYVLSWRHTSWHSKLSFKNTCGAGKLVRLADLKGGVHKPGK